MGTRARLLPASAGALLAALGLAACGTATVSTSQLHGDSKAVAQTISDFQHDAQNRDQTKLCNNDLASTVVARLKATGGSCTTVISNQLKEVDNGDLTLASSNAIAVTGTTATARVKTTSANKIRFDTLTLVKEGTRWKVSGLQ
jgi:ribonuclease HI